MTLDDAFFRGINTDPDSVIIVEWRKLEQRFSDPHELQTAILGW